MKPSQGSAEGAPPASPPSSTARSEATLRMVLVGLIVVAGVVGVSRLFPHNRPLGAHALRPPASAARKPTGTPIDTSQFAAGSCISFPPTHGNRHRTVFLDAGHGGVDPGAVGTTSSRTTVYEKNLTLAVELDTASLLRADGYRVVVSRTNGGPVAIPRPGDLAGGIFTTTGAHVEVAARDICANLAKADVLIGIYFDAGASARDAGSITDYDASRPFSAENLRLGRLLQRNVLTDMNAQGWGIPNGGVNSDVYEGGPALTSAAANYDHLLLLGPAEAGYFSNPSEMPGAIIEPLFVTDPFEASIADSSKGQHVIAGGIVTTVEQFLGTSGT